MQTEHPFSQLERAHLICVLQTVAGFVFCDGKRFAYISRAESVGDVADFFSDHKRVFIFAHAKPSLKELLRVGVDVARPLCLHTLERLLSRTHIDAPAASFIRLEEAISSALAMQEKLQQFMTEIDTKQLAKVARLECLSSRAFAAMEWRGLHVDTSAWNAIVEQSKNTMAGAKTQLLDLLHLDDKGDLFGGNELNLDSGKEVKTALENLLGVQLANTSQNTLSEITHPAVQLLLQYREHAKVVQTYGDNFLAFVDAKTGRIHPTFEPLGSSTGRASCHSPNLQNLPADDEFHKCIKAPSGRMLVTADYATCELRILADLSGDETFLQAFANDEDLHASVASRMFNVPVTKTENQHLRQKAKAINFGLMYGMGAKALARTLRVRDDEAQGLLDQYFRTYPRVKRYLDDAVDKALTQGFASTVLGRKLWFDEDVLKGKNARGELSRIARNMPIQGSAADMIKLAMLRVHESLREQFPSAGLVNMIHDELVVECDAEHANDVAVLVKNEMEAAQATISPNVTPKAEVQIGAYWQH